MNILDVQDNLKNFSEKQLINEMQMPSGNAPQFLVLSEITRRKRMRDQLNMQKAANEPTVAQEAVASAGVPAQGIMGMSEAMAPKAAMAQGGIGSVMSQPMKPQMPQSMPMPDQGVMAMSSGGSTKTKIEERRMKNGKIGLFKGNTFLGTKQESGGLGSLAEKIGFGGKSNVLDSIKGALGFAEGGVIKAQNGLPLGLRQRNPGNIRPGAGFIGESGDGGGYATFGSDDEGLRAIQKLLMTYGDKYDIKTLRQLANRYAPPSDNNPTDSYIDFLSDKTGIGADDEINLAESGSSIIPAIVGFEQGQQPYSQAQIDRAIRAAGTDDPKKVAEILGKPLSDDILNQRLDQEPDMLSSLMGANAATNDEINPQLIDSGRSSPAVVAAERLKKLRAMTVDKESGNQTTGADMPAGELSELFPDAGFFATDQEENRIREEQLNKATTADPDFEVMPVVAEVKNDLANVGIGSTSAVNAAKAAKTDVGKKPVENVPIYSDAATGTATSLEGEILAMQERMKKSAEQDKWLSLAQAGLSLMSSTNPNFLGALGEAGISGLSAMKEAESRYQEGVVDLINARAKLAKNKTGMDAGNAVSRLNKVTDLLIKGVDDLGGPLDPDAKARLEQESQYLRREILKYPEYTTGANTPPPAS